MASAVDASLHLWRHLHGTFGVRSLSKIPAKDSRQMKVTRMEGGKGMVNNLKALRGEGVRNCKEEHTLDFNS